MRHHFESHHFMGRRGSAPGARGGHGRHGGRAGHGGGFGGHDGHDGHGGRGGRGRGDGTRVFDHGELRLVVLALIAESPRHGYEIIKAIEERFAGSYSPSPGVIYPTLTMLQELRYASVEEHDDRKRYTITQEGRQYIADNQVAVDAALARMQEAGARHGGGRAPQIIRAMENLKTALRLRMGRGPLEEAQLQAVAAAIDAAALAIERS